MRSDEDSDPIIASRLDLSRTQVFRARTDGHITLSMADRLASHLGEHPAFIWRDAYWEANQQWLDTSSPSARAHRRMLDARHRRAQQKDTT